MDVGLIRFDKGCPEESKQPAMKFDLILEDLLSKSSRGKCPY